MTVRCIRLSLHHSVTLKSVSLKEEEEKEWRAEERKEGGFRSENVLFMSPLHHQTYHCSQTNPIREVKPK